MLAGGTTDFSLFAGQFWVATRSGVASTPASNPNPSAPESWQVYTAVQGLPSNRVNRFVVAFDSLYAATSSGLAVYTGSGWNLVAGTAGLNVLDCSSGRPPCVDCSGLYFISGTDLMTYVPASGVNSRSRSSRSRWTRTRTPDTGAGS